jgi:hypothetical protein
MTTTDKMTVSGPLFVILLIHWEVVKWICSLFLGHLAIGREDCGCQMSEQLTCVCPKSWPQSNQHSMTTTDQMTVSGPLFDILLIHWEVVKWICSLFLGHLAIGREDCGCQTSEQLIYVFAPSLGHKSNTP